MSSNDNNQLTDNKHFVIRAKTILKDMGVEASTSQVYELFSKLSGEKNWNIAKSKDINFLDKLQSLFTPSPPTVSNKQEEFDAWLKKNQKLLELKYYEHCLKNGDFNDKLCYGVTKESKGFELKVPFHDPTALYVGSMGSGKSQSMKFTALTHLLANSEKTIYLLYDDQKGMGDYEVMFNLHSNVVKIINQEDKIIPMIEMLYHEIEARQLKFRETGANGLPAYENKMKELNSNDLGLARIVVCLEEFNYVINNKILDFKNNKYKVGTTAYKFRHILMVGRSYGIFVLAASGSATSDNFPASLIPFFSMKMGFRTTSRDLNHIGIYETEDIQKQGRCLVDRNFMQFLYFNDQTSLKLLEKYFKPLKANCLKVSFEDFKRLEE